MNCMTPRVSKDLKNTQSSYTGSFRLPEGKIKWAPFYQTLKTVQMWLC